MKKNTNFYRLAVAAGKGGVGKSSVSVNLALSLALCGARVGILDADLYGPSIGKMLPIEEEMREEQGWIIPAKGLGIHYVSLSLCSLGKQATIVRAPIANQIISEFLKHVFWPELDVLLIDFPPGTGDVQLTIMQQANLFGAILVTTPQQVALLDVKKAYEMFQHMQVPIMGVVENMSYFEPCKEQRVYPMGCGGGVGFCKEHNLTLLGQIPLEPQISRCCDEGKSLLEQFPGSSASVVFEKMGQDLFLALMKKTKEEKGMLKGFELIWKENS